ncbi:MAG: 3D domain-containing protein [Symbiobacteriaceae bacterium]|nr:3D domain-containing protein [Symbiobacteriaceae bacterium]
MVITTRKVRLPAQRSGFTLSGQKTRHLQMQILRHILILCLVCGLLPWTGVTYYRAYSEMQYLDITISIDGLEQTTHTLERQVSAVLASLHVVLLPEDTCDPLPDTVFDEDLTIFITRATPVWLTVDGQCREYRTRVATVAEFISEQGVAVASDDRLLPAGDTLLTPGLEISITRIQRFHLSMQYPLPYGIIREESSALGQGYEQRVRGGQEGLAEDIMEVILEDGVEVERFLLSSAVVQPVVHELIHVGTAGLAEYDEDSFPFQRMYIMETTGYCPCYYCCGKYPDHPAYGITCSGLLAGRGVVGADLNVFPLGTKLYIEGYGYCVVGDTGSGVMGRNRIDLGFATHQEAYDWALRRETAIYVLYDD